METLPLSGRRVCETRNTSSTSEWSKGGHTSLVVVVVVRRRAKSLSRITQAASHQAKEIIGGNEVATYKACVSLYCGKEQKKKTL